MPGGFDRGLVPPIPWTDAPDAAQRLRALNDTRPIDADEANDLLHFIFHDWVLGPQAIELIPMGEFTHRAPGWRAAVCRIKPHTSGHSSWRLV